MQKEKHLPMGVQTAGGIMGTNVALGPCIPTGKVIKVWKLVRGYKDRELHGKGDELQ